MEAEGFDQDFNKTPTFQSAPSSFPPPPIYCATLDIETSGLSPEDSHITAIGLGTPYGFHIYSNSWVNLNLTPEESEIHTIKTFLRDLDNNLSNIYAVITYNGAFDFSFLKTRFAYHNIDFPKKLEKLDHIDLALFVKRLNKYNTSKDQACNKFANIYVPRKNSGAFLARVYQHLKVTHDIHMDMLGHNAIDLTATAKLYKFFLDYGDFQVFYQNLLHPQQIDETGGKK